MTPDRVTIVVLNWNRRDETIGCIESLEQADLRGATVMVVDNGSHDGSVAALRARFPALRIVELPENRGYAGGNNAGIRAALDAGAEGVLLLNNDTRVASDFLHPLIDAMNSSPWSGAVSGAILRRDRPDMLDVAYSEVFFDQRYVVYIRGVNALIGHGFDKRQEVAVAVGCCLLLKAETLRKVGLFDEAYFAYHEDVDWCLRARRAGYQIFFEPYSRVFHLASSSTARLRAKPAPRAPAPGEPELPNAEPMPWNPVRAYLGARNVIRLLRAYATPEERRAFRDRCRHDLPLEYLAIVMGREGHMRLGVWNYREMVRWYFGDRHSVLRGTAGGLPGRVGRALARAVLLPIDVLWSLPRDIVRTEWSGRTGEFWEHVKGLRDGVLDRPLPLERLGLR